MSEGTCGFQRARRPEQREARRQAILDAAAAMLAEFPVNDISLRELSRRVGLAKSNVLRYFETREEVFLELLDRSGREWLDELAERLVQISDDSDPVGRVAAELAGSLTARPLFCELVSAMASVLERNISVDVARRFKLRMMETATVLVGLLREHVPGLTEEGAGQFVAALLALVAGLWPFAHPTDAVRAAIEELGLDASHLDFAASLREAAATHLTGVLARYAVRP